MDYLKNIDGFGIPINLSFGDHSGTYKTKFGAIVTILMFSAGLATCVKNADRMFNFRNPNIAIFSNSVPDSSLIGTKFS